MKTPTSTKTMLSLPLTYLCAGILTVSTIEAHGQERKAPPPEPTHAAPTAPAEGETSQKAAAPAKVDLEYLFQQLDTNNDGKLTREEFNGLSSMLASLVAPPAEDLDNTKSQVTGIAQISAGSVTGLNDPEGLFRKLDTNGDGKLSPEEFKKIGPMLERVQAPKQEAARHDRKEAAKKTEKQKKDDADKGTNLPEVGSGGSSSGARDSATGR